MQQVAELAHALQWLGNCAPGRWTTIISGAGPALDHTLAELRGACHAWGDLQACFVAIGRGRRRGPRVAAADLVSLDGDALHRRVFLAAVALAAGRDTAPAAPAAQDSSFGVDTMPAPLAMQPASPQGASILVAEDHEINQKVVLRQLALLGYTADIASTGRQALEWWRRGDYALLLTDLHMPDMDGYELALAIREDEAGLRRIPIIAFTANALKGEAQRCRAVGMDDYMTKPVQLADLKAMLAKWLSRSTPPGADLAAPHAKTAAAHGLALDVRVLKALVGNEPQVIREFLRDFRVSAGQALTQMRAACQARQATEVGALAHRLKSSARSVGALALGELCAQLEQAGLAGRLDALADLWPRLETEMALVDEILDSSQT